VAAPGSGAASTARMTATPWAPAAHMAGTSFGSMPPIASTGTLDTAVAVSSRAMPCGGPNATLDGVARTGPKTA
jgi:hypothetical protein